MFEVYMTLHYLSTMQLTIGQSHRPVRFASRIATPRSILGNFNILTSHKVLDDLHTNRVLLFELGLIKHKIDRTTCITISTSLATLGACSGLEETLVIMRVASVKNYKHDLSFNQLSILRIIYPKPFIVKP